MGRPSRCDLAEMQLRLHKPKEAREAVASLIEDKLYAKSRYHGLALYYHGFACFQLKDDFAAGNRLPNWHRSPTRFSAATLRYLLARIYHNDPANNQRQEAMQQYQGVIDDYANKKKPPPRRSNRATASRMIPKRKPVSKHWCAAAPDYVARASFFLGVMQYEDGKFADALTHFTTFIQQHPALAADGRGAVAAGLLSGAIEAVRRRHQDAPTARGQRAALGRSVPLMDRQSSGRRRRPHQGAGL